jgi:ribulose-5-phosphate 4-epimerase/fuculose-1-phosphate aldolase
MADAYWMAVTVIEAQEVLIKLRIADYPNMKKDDRSKTHRHFHKMAYPRTHENPKKLTTKELGERLKVALNG